MIETMRTIDPRDPRIQRLGRFDWTEDSCALWWTGAGIDFRIACRRLEIEASAEESEHAAWLMASVDGAPVARFALMPGAHRYPILEGMDPHVSHEVTICRDTQPHDTDRGPVRLLALISDGEPMPAQPRRRIVEFIGDSLTAGEGLVGAKSAMEWRTAWISTFGAFPTLAAERLQAARRVFALGGWGVWRGWDGDPHARIGRVYRQLCAVVPGGEGEYPFAMHRPADAVVINLGTNDASALALLSEDRQAEARLEITQCAVELMDIVRDAAPEAVIVWAYGLLGDALAAEFQSAVALRREAGDERTYYLALDDCAGGFGSREHPGANAHARAAEQISEMLEGLLNAPKRR